ncbi:hypothetical protein D9M68_641110 [compost metagenome]
MACEVVPHRRSNGAGACPSGNIQQSLDLVERHRAGQDVPRIVRRVAHYPVHQVKHRRIEKAETVVMARLDEGAVKFAQRQKKVLRPRHKLVAARAFGVQSTERLTDP